MVIGQDLYGRGFDDLFAHVAAGTVVRADKVHDANRIRSVL